MRGLRVQPNGCWVWLGSINFKGYGQIGSGAPEHKTVAVHRAIYRLKCGPIPRGKLVLHRCDNRRCANPDHLWVGTSMDNTQDMIAKGRHPGGPRGSENQKSKLTARQVRAIRRRHKNGESCYSLAKVFPINRASVYAIVTRKNWAWLK